MQKRTNCYVWTGRGQQVELVSQHGMSWILTMKSCSQLTGDKSAVLQHPREAPEYIKSVKQHDSHSHELS